MRRALVILLLLLSGLRLSAQEPDCIRIHPGQLFLRHHVDNTGLCVCLLNLSSGLCFGSISFIDSFSLSSFSFICFRFYCFRVLASALGAAVLFF